MPKTVVSIKATMRDHTMSVPAPENTVAFGIPNACTECHTDRKPAWAVERARASGGRDGRRAKLVERAEAFTAARAKRPEALDRLIAIAADESDRPLIRANAAGHLRNYADPRAAAALLAAAKAADPVIRAVAISSLGQARHRERSCQVRGRRGARRSAARGPHRRARLARSISAAAGCRPAISNASAASAAEFAKMERLYRDDAGFERDLGVVHLLDGQHDLAAQSLEITLGLEPDRPSARFLLAVARIAQRRFDDARALLLQVPASDPFYRSAQDRLKTLAPPQ